MLHCIQHDNQSNSCNSWDEAVPFVIKLGFSALHGIEKACNNLGKIKEKFGKEISLLGNMDIVDLTKKSPAQIEKETKDMVNSGMTNGGYVAGCNTLVAKYIPAENYLECIGISFFGEQGGSHYVELRCSARLLLQA